MTARSLAEKARQLETGDLVPNAPFRERLQWLQRMDSELTAATICHRMHAMGFTNFVRRRPNSKGYSNPDTSYLLRALGLYPQQPSLRSNGVRYEGGMREVIPYEMAVGLCRALEADPVDMGV